jgi:hypothetical protein
MPPRRTAAKLVRFTPDELAAVHRRAHACGRTSARFFREAALGAIPKARHHETAIASCSPSRAWADGSPCCPVARTPTSHLTGAPVIVKTSSGKRFGPLAYYLAHGRSGVQSDRVAWTVSRNLGTDNPEPGRRPDVGDRAAERTGADPCLSPGDQLRSPRPRDAGTDAGRGRPRAAGSTSRRIRKRSSP